MECADKITEDQFSEYMTEIEQRDMKTTVTIDGEEIVTFPDSPELPGLVDRAGRQLLTVEEAFEKTGGFGCFQKFSIIMNTLANGGAAFFLYAFAFLEAEPKFKCQFNPDSLEWTYGTKTRPLEEEFCNV